jgi:putative DNA primase/helicase
MINHMKIGENDVILKQRARAESPLYEYVLPLALLGGTMRHLGGRECEAQHLAGHTAEDLLRLAESTPVWSPRRDPDEANKPEIKSGLLTIRAANVTPKRVDAIWKDANGGIRLARGEHTIIAGEPGLGKSQVTVAVAATITIGGGWPLGEGRAPLGNVIILAAEDSVPHTTVPRLTAAGADLKRVYFVQAAVAEEGKGQRMFNFQADLAKLKALIREIGDVVLLIIDPVTAYLGKIDSHKNADVPAVLAPLGELAQEGNVAIASVTHFTKGTGGASTRAIDRIIGSIAFVAAPRTGLTVIADPDNQDRRLLLHVKNNISRSPQGIAFRLEQHIVGSDEQGDFVGSCVAWEGEPVEKRLTRLWAAMATNSKRPRPTRSSSCLTCLPRARPRRKTLRRRREPHVCWARLN